MNFGDCTDCGMFKYLEQDRTCPSCMDDQRKDWTVQFYSSSIYRDVTALQEPLTEHDARRIAADNPLLIPCRTVTD